MPAASARFVLTAAIQLAPLLPALALIRQANRTQLVLLLDLAGLAVSLALAEENTENSSPTVASNPTAATTPPATTVTLGPPIILPVSIAPTTVASLANPSPTSTPSTPPPSLPTNARIVASSTLATLMTAAGGTCSCTCTPPPSSSTPLQTPIVAVQVSTVAPPTSTSTAATTQTTSTASTTTSPITTTSTSTSTTGTQVTTTTTTGPPPPATFQPQTMPILQPSASPPANGAQCGDSTKFKLLTAHAQAASVPVGKFGGYFLMQWSCEELCVQNYGLERCIGYMYEPTTLGKCTLFQYNLPTQLQEDPNSNAVVCMKNT